MLHKTGLKLLVSAAVVPLAMVPAHAWAQQNRAPAATQVDEDDTIIVTARRRAEDIQRVPDSITAFSAATVESAGINDIQDIADLVPNVSMRKGYRTGESNITIRGITSGRQGWPPVSFIVDGVRAPSIDAMEQGALIDIQAIEVIKGPQGALYGAGAIGGAINITTRRPGNEFAGRAQATYARGNDIRLSGSLSGPLVEDKLTFSVAGYFNTTDGLVENAERTARVDGRTQWIGRARLMFTPSDTVTFDLRASIADSDGSAAGLVDKISSPLLIDEFRTPATPGPSRRADFLGKETRRFYNASLKTDVEMDFAMLSAVVAYEKLDQRLFATGNYEAAPVTLASHTLYGSPTYGNAATAGQVIDEFQDTMDNFRTWSGDIRLTSPSNQPLRWVVGTELLHREYFTFLSTGQLIAPDTRNSPTFRWDRKLDNIWGIYAQLSYDLAKGLELTVAGRYDQDKFSNGQITDPVTMKPIQSLDTSGKLVDRVHTSDSRFTPKAQLAYSWTSRIMTYLTYSEGFRFGFFNTGNRTLAESTRNYEAGIRTRLFDRLLTLNGSAFHTIYSDQQVTLTIPTPPYRTTTNIPRTNINGFEAEAVLTPSPNLMLSGAVGYTDAIVQNAARTQAPNTSKWTANAAVQLTEPLTDALTMIGRIDYRYQGSMFIRPNEVYPIKAKTYIDARLGVETERFNVKLFVENLLDTQQAYSLSPYAGGFVRTFNLPRTYGIEVGAKF